MTSIAARSGHCIRRPEGRAATDPGAATLTRPPQAACAPLARPSARSYVARYGSGPPATSLTDGAEAVITAAEARTPRWDCPPSRARGWRVPGRHYRARRLFRRFHPNGHLRVMPTSGGLRNVRVNQTCTGGRDSNGRSRARLLQGWRGRHRGNAHQSRHPGRRGRGCLSRAHRHAAGKGRRPEGDRCDAGTHSPACGRRCRRARHPAGRGRILARPRHRNQVRSCGQAM
jgi:hypothetical protein